MASWRPLPKKYRWWWTFASGAVGTAPWLRTPFGRLVSTAARGVGVGGGTKKDAPFVPSIAPLVAPNKPSLHVRRHVGSLTCFGPFHPLLILVVSLLKHFFNVLSRLYRPAPCHLGRHQRFANGPPLRHPPRTRDKLWSVLF